MLPLVLVAAMACADSASTPSAPSLLLAGSTATRVDLTPDAFTLKPGAARGLATATTYSDGSVIRGDTAVRFRSLDTLVATVSAAGVATARTLGTARLVATNGMAADTVHLVVTANRVASVSLSPSALTLAAGRSTIVWVTLRDSTGVVLTDRPVAWSSTDSTVASPRGSGSSGIDVYAYKGGVATVRATSEGAVGASTVTVPTTGPATNECAAPKSGWLWCDDFEMDRRAQYFERDSAGGKFVRAAAVGANASYGMRARFDSGTVSAGSLKLAFGRTPSSYFRPVDAGTANYREIFWRWYVRYEPTWTGGAGFKMTRATVFAGSNWSQAMIAHVWGGSSAPRSDYLIADPASGTDAVGTVLTTKYNDFDHLRWIGAVQTKTPIFDAVHVGRWYCVEAHTRLNDAGLANGQFQVWIDGALEADRSDLNWLGTYGAYGINAVLLENYWNTGSPKRQERYFDNFVVGTQRIGC